MVGMRRNERPTRRKPKATREVESRKDDSTEDLSDIDVDLDIDDLDDYDDDLSDLDDDYDIKENSRQSNKETMNKNYQNRNPKRINSRDSNKKNLLMLLIGFVTIVVIVLALLLIFGKDDKGDTTNNATQENTIGQIPANNSDITGGGSTPPPSNQNTQQNTNQQNTYGQSNQQPNQQGVVMEDGVNPGLPDTKNGTKMNNSGEMIDTKGFISDVNGNKIPKDFVVQRVADETDFVNYVKRRGMTGDGVELLWLDAQYKGIPYSVQVPFKIWKELDQQGITVVDMEVLYLEDGSKVISYMKVKDNYKEILEEKK